MRNWTKGLLKSFDYALQGIIYAIVTQRNMQIHLVITFFVLVGAVYFRVNSQETLILIGAILIVLMAELFNTAIEKTVDLVTEQFHPLAKIAKDTAAGAVFLAASLSVFAGVFVFYPYLFPEQDRIPPIVFVIILFFFILLIAGKAITMISKKSDHNNRKE